MQSYIKSFGGNIEDNAHVSTLSDLNHFDELTMKKKLVICDMVRLSKKEILQKRLTSPFSNRF